MKVVIFGASGIIGQHMRLCVPEGVEPIWVRRTADPIHVGLDLTDRSAVSAFLKQQAPAAIVNLAGESNTDAVEKDPGRYLAVNVDVPCELADWAGQNSAHYVHVSSQAVFGGDCPPYDAASELHPVNEYGRQKAGAERLAFRPTTTIVRPTFVLGVRPFKYIGRQNPLEQMLALDAQRQVADRWFSVSFARDVAADLWAIVAYRAAAGPGAVHLGIPLRVSRYELASLVKRGVEMVSHDDFPGIAPRPLDTTYAGSIPEPGVLCNGISECAQEFDERYDFTLAARARELSLFLGVPAKKCLSELERGFHELHADVAKDWNTINPRTDNEILAWYRRTETYLWELSVYHADLPSCNFNYTGMCKGIAERLRAEGTRRVLCLGDGIGDLTLSLTREGFEAVYHDLSGSRTADFAQFRFWMHQGKYLPAQLTNGWEPQFPTHPNHQYDAVVSLDFLEHVTDVPAWTMAIRNSLRPGGLFLAQNAFACGSGPEGSIPCHLARNDRYSTDWTPLLQSLKFTQEGASNWWRKQATAKCSCKYRAGTSAYGGTIIDSTDCAVHCAKSGSSVQA